MLVSFSKSLAIRSATVLILTLGLDLASTSAIASEQPFGFIENRSQSPLQQLRFGPIHHLPWILPNNSYSFSLRHNWTNMWLDKADAYHIDAEIHELNARYRVGLGHGFEIGAEFPMRYVSGGMLDGMIESFHRSFGIGNAGRDSYPRDDFAFMVKNGVGEGGWSEMETEPTGWKLGNATVALSADLGRFIPERFMGVITFEIKLPTGARIEFFGRQKIDLSLSLSTATRTGPLHWYLSSAVTYFGDDEMIDIELRRWHFSNLIGLEYTAGNGAYAWTVQLLAENGVARDFYKFSDASYEMMFGHKRHLSERLTLEVGFIENVLAFDNSPDVGFHTAVTYGI